jgi:AcrR family transcriptional regulator
MSPRTPGQFREIREEKMTLIMDVALQHFANEGYFKSTITHIAKRAGISKGLMYNYFESKEALLMAIVNRSVKEIYNYFDINRDGYLSEEEFVYFIKKISAVLKEKRSFWRLLMQLLLQNEVREQFMKAYPVTDPLTRMDPEPDDNRYPSLMMKMITDYFTRKRKRMGKDYDPENEINMFLVTLKGFAITSIFSDNSDEVNNEKIINRIIELFK